MRLQRNILPLLTAGLCLTLFTGTANADKHKETGTTIWVETSSEGTELANGHTVKRTTNEGISLSDDPKSVFHNAKQISSGSDIYDAAGELLGSYGYGEIRVSDGDLAFYSYSNSPETDAVWTIIGGTGKFAGITGGGTSDAVHMGEGRQVHRWKGSWKLKD